MNDVKNEIESIKNHPGIDLSMIEKTLCEAREAVTLIGNMLPPGLPKSIIVGASVLLNLFCSYLPK